MHHDELKIHQVLSPYGFLVRRTMQFLRNLIGYAHERHRLGFREAEIGEHGLQFIVQGNKIGLVRISDLVVGNFKRHGTPCTVSVCQLDLKRLHHIRFRNISGMCLRHSHKTSGKTVPPNRQTVVETCDEISFSHASRRVEVHGVSRSRTTIPQFERTAASHDGSVKELSHDHVRNHRA